MSMPVFPDFKLLELGDRGAIEAFTLRFEPYSDLNFTSLWCWNTNDEVAWSVHEHNLVVRLPSYGGDGPPRFSQLGEHELAATVRHVLTEESVGNQLSLGPAVVAERLMVDDGFLVVEDRDNADYVIDIATFLARVGGSYEKVRQRIRRFAARASTVIDLDLGSQVHRDFVVHVASRWLDSHCSGD